MKPTNKPKNPANKKYGFCEPKTNDDKVWSLKLQKSWNEKGKEKNIEISRKHATKYQLEQLAKYQANELSKNTHN